VPASTVVFTPDSRHRPAADARGDAGGGPGVLPIE
jgi:hypothetical protein